LERRAFARFLIVKMTAQICFAVAAIRLVR